MKNLTESPFGEVIYAYTRAQAIGTGTGAHNRVACHPDEVPEASGLVLSGHAGRDGDVVLKYGARKEHREFNPGFLCSFSDFDLYSVCNSLCAGISEDDFSERRIVFIHFHIVLLSCVRDIHMV